MLHVSLFVFAALLLWGVLVVAWSVGWIHNRRKAPPAEKRTSTRVLSVVTFVIVVGMTLFVPRVVWRPLTDAIVALQIVGLVLVVGGLGFTLWARVVLGTMWSGGVESKTSHELRTAGPYAVTRHPIYTGLLTMLAGSALASGFGITVLYFAAIAVAFAIKMAWEERLLVDTFGEQYRAYRRKVPALVPGLKILR